MPTPRQGHSCGHRARHQARNSGQDGEGTVFILAETVGRKGSDTLRTGTGWEGTQSSYIPATTGSYGRHLRERGRARVPMGWVVGLTDKLSALLACETTF